MLSERFLSCCMTIRCSIRSISQYGFRSSASTMLKRMSAFQRDNPSLMLAVAHQSWQKGCLLQTSKISSSGTVMLESSGIAIDSRKLGIAIRRHCSPRHRFRKPVKRKSCPSSALGRKWNGKKATRRPHLRSLLQLFCQLTPEQTCSIHSCRVIAMCRQRRRPW